MNQPFRIGQIVPSSNTTMETEIPAMLTARQAIRPERFTFHSSRMRMKTVRKEELAAIATTYALLKQLGLERVVPGAGALLSGAY
jgi:maleate cis-trans isomerase